MLKGNDEYYVIEQFDLKADEDSLNNNNNLLNVTDKNIMNSLSVR